jgi:hypothetical protein
LPQSKAASNGHVWFVPVGSTWESRATKKGLTLTLISAGFLFFIPGVLWLCNHGLSQDDAAAALSPLARVPLHQLQNSDSAAVIVTIPNNAQWSRIRGKWGEPDYLIAAIEHPQSARLVHCFDQLGIKVEATNESGLIPLKTAQGCCPYGYSSACPDSGQEFRAATGSDLTLDATSTTHSMPVGELIVICYWKNNVKDKLVGIMLDDDLWRISEIAGPIGFILILSGVSALVRRRVVSGQ